MISKDIIDAFSDLAKDRGIDRTSLGTIVEELFMSLVHKKYGLERENFSVIANIEKGEIEIRDSAFRDVKRIQMYLPDWAFSISCDHTWVVGSHQKVVTLQCDHATLRSVSLVGDRNPFLDIWSACSSLCRTTGVFN